MISLWGLCLYKWLFCLGCPFILPKTKLSCYISTTVIYVKKKTYDVTLFSQHTLFSLIFLFSSPSCLTSLSISHAFSYSFSFSIIFLSQSLSHSSILSLSISISLIVSLFLILFFNLILSLSFPRPSIPIVVFIYLCSFTQRKSKLHQKFKKQRRIYVRIKTYWICGAFVTGPLTGTKSNSDWQKFAPKTQNAKNNTNEFRPYTEIKWIYREKKEKKKKTDSKLAETTLDFLLQIRIQLFQNRIVDW